MNTLKGIVTDLRQRRLWIVAVALVVALVAVPVLLSKKASSGTPVAQLPATGAPTSLVTGGPAITVEGTPNQTHLKGKGRDPFTPQKSSAKPATASSAVTTTASTSGSAGSLGSAGSTAGSAAGGASGSTGSVTSSGSSGGGAPSATSTPPSTAPSTPSATPPATGIPSGKSQPTPAGLQATETYRVTLAITNSKGGLNRLDPLERLSVLPSQSDPLLVELGVLKGGDRVLFMVQPGTVLHGPGRCTPGPIDCEVLSLGTNQVEGISVQTPTGVSAVAQFAVTAIGTDNHGSRGAADKARRAASAAGRRLLNNSTLKALSLFQYEPSLGAVLDLRNLTVGGN
jgi:hypothetical protein